MGVELVVTETRGLSSTEHRRALDTLPRWRVVAMVTSWRYVFITWIVPTLQRGNIEALQRGNDVYLGLNGI